MEKAPLESYADIGGLEDQIQEIKEAVELPLTHPELCVAAFVCCAPALVLTWPVGTRTSGSSRQRESSCTASRGRGRRCSLRRSLTRPLQPSCEVRKLARRDAGAPSDARPRNAVVGSELIQKYLGDGPKLVRELFRVADELAPSIVFIGAFLLAFDFRCDHADCPMQTRSMRLARSAMTALPAVSARSSAPCLSF